MNILVRDITYLDPGNLLSKTGDIERRFSQMETKWRERFFDLVKFQILYLSKTTFVVRTVMLVDDDGIFDILHGRMFEDEVSCKAGAWSCP